MLILLLLLLLSEAFTSSVLCTAGSYSAYLNTYSMKYGNEYEDYFKKYLNSWMTTCQAMNRNNLFFSFPKRLNILADFHRSDLIDMMNLKIKYSGLGSYYDPITVSIHQFYQPVHYRDLCTDDHPSLIHYSKSHDCAISWATATIAAAELALQKRGIQEKLSLEYLLECFQDDQREDTCDGVAMPDLQEFLSTIGLMSEYEAIRLGKDKCTTRNAYRYVFDIEKLEGLNRGGLMTVVSSGVPTLSLLALDLLKMRYADSMNMTSFPFTGQTSQPTVYGVVTGYNDDSIDGHWMVDIGVTPCEHIELKIPMKNDETGANYAGIAGYAFGLRYIGQDIPSSSPSPTLPSSPTPEPWFPIYDPFILGDNTNYEVQSTCYDQIIPDIEVLRRYLAIRDDFPTKALKHTRVLALSGMTQPTVELFHDSLAAQTEKNPLPIDMYFYSDYKLRRYVDATLAVPLISLSEFTRPSRIVFGDGSFMMEGLNTLIQWMVDNRDKGYFKNLEYLQVTGHKAASYDVNTANITEIIDMIVDNLYTMCTDKLSFPRLTAMNFNNNAFDESSDGFDIALRDACDTNETGVSISASGQPVAYETMCSTTSGNNLSYYDMTDEKDVKQCRFTWSWEMGDTLNTYGDGPYPNENTEAC